MSSMKTGGDTIQYPAPVAGGAPGADYRPRCVLAVSAHPDDDTLFAGGTLAKYAAEGYDDYTLDPTRAAAGLLGEPPGGPKEQLGVAEEAVAPCAALTLQQ